MSRLFFFFSVCKAYVTLEPTLVFADVRDSLGSFLRHGYRVARRPFLTELMECWWAEEWPALAVDAAFFLFFSRPVLRAVFFGI